MKLYDQITAFLDGAVDAAVVLDADRRVHYYNNAYQALTGLRGRQLAERVVGGARCYELFKLDVCESACVGCRAHGANRRVRVDEIGAVRGDGEAMTCIVTAVPIELPDGERLVIETYRDVTADVRIQRRLKVALEHERRAKGSLEEMVRERTAELRAAQAQLVHQEKMSSLGRLVAGIAHELNNPINFVYGNVDFLGQYMENLLRLVAVVDQAGALAPETRAAFERTKEEIEFDFLVGDWQKLLRSIRAGAERTAAIVADLKSFARTGGTELAEADLVGGIETSLNLIAPLLKNRVEVRRAIAPNIPRVVCNAGHVNQVFMNILTNAAQAIVGTGWIEVAISLVDDTHVRVVISDSGPGISPPVMAKIGDPFFTTKEVGEGTGLGLWITANIIRAHGGTLAWGNRAGAGAEFAVTLPVRGPSRADEPSGGSQG